MIVLGSFALISFVRALECLESLHLNTKPRDRVYVCTYMHVCMLVCVSVYVCVHAGDASIVGGDVKNIAFVATDEYVCMYVRVSECVCVYIQAM